MTEQEYNDIMAAIKKAIAETEPPLTQNPPGWREVDGVQLPPITWAETTGADMVRETDRFMCRWDMANGVRRAHGMPEMLYGEAHNAIPRRGLTGQDATDAARDHAQDHRKNWNGE